MILSEALRRVKFIDVVGLDTPVLNAVAAELGQNCGHEVLVREYQADQKREPGALLVCAGLDAVPAERRPAFDGIGESGAVFLQLGQDGAGCVLASHERLLFSFLIHLIRDLFDEDLCLVQDGRLFETAFSWNRSVYDFFLAQEGRIQAGLNRETYVRSLAESGFTHVEVNGLAFPEGLESGPAGEAYPMFYTYCPALDQFVTSQLNRGLYPAEYLSQNLEYLKTNAELVRSYGLVPGLLCFEPRSVPEEFFNRYPMLRGARVDHPFRSFKPRYNMTIAHPLVREHYAQMVRKLMEAVPDLGFLSIWTNDSGAGFEHTQSLYVGRNGGAYLIREWKDNKEIAQTAGANALRFLAVLRDAACETNSEFRVLTRLESFYGEHDVIWGGLKDGLDAEATSLVSRGWENPYTHARYPDSKAFVGGTIHQQSFSERERELASELDRRSSAAHFYCAVGPNTLFAPLLGIPYPSFTIRRLRLLWQNGVTRLAHLGGTCPPELVPFNVNHEILRAFQFDPEMESAEAIGRLARRWAGEELAEQLAVAWALCEEAIISFPHVTPLYSTYGFVWYRLWARPLVPNIEAIPEQERAYYQDFMCTTPHNPNNVDLSRDVLFQLTTVDECNRALTRIDANVWEPLDHAIELLEEVRDRALARLGENNVFHDMSVRMKALRCWILTQRSVAAWVVGVKGYVNADKNTDRAECRSILDTMIGKEIDNSNRLLDLLDTGVEFMATTDLTETPLIHGRNLREILLKRISLMEEHRGDEPHIDPEYVEKMAAQCRL